MTRKQKLIVQSWELHEEREPDISTEQLMAMVSNDMGVDVDVIVAALVAAALLGKDMS
jgi:ribosomal protein L12E/L44/L45/RPP1/RPP2